MKNADGTVKRLTTFAYADADPTWSPDGAKIAFTSHHSGDAQIWSVSSTGGTPTRITHSSNLDKAPAYTH